MTNCSNTMCPRSVSPQQLTAMAGYAAENRDELETQKKRVRLRYFAYLCHRAHSNDVLYSLQMKENTTVMTTSIWATVWLIVWVLLMFCGGYAVIRLFPAPRAYPTCPAPTYEHGEL
jgi:hypothetical protein